MIFEEPAFQQPKLDLTLAHYLLDQTLPQELAESAPRATDAMLRTPILKLSASFQMTRPRECRRQAASPMLVDRSRKAPTRLCVSTASTKACSAPGLLALSSTTPHLSTSWMPSRSSRAPTLPALWLKLLTLALFTSSTRSLDFLHEFALGLCSSTSAPKSPLFPFAPCGPRVRRILFIRLGVLCLACLSFVFHTSVCRSLILPSPTVTHLSYRLSSFQSFPLTSIGIIKIRIKTSSSV